MTTSRTITSALIWTFFICFVSSAIDLNIHHLQMVADHLTEKQCDLLLDELNGTGSFKVKNAYKESENAINKTAYSSDTETFDNCLESLIQWNIHEEKGKTFVELAIRLSVIGRRDLADILEKTVLEETEKKVSTK